LISETQVNRIVSSLQSPTNDPSVDASYRLSEGIEIELSIEVADPAVENPDAGLSHSLPRSVSLNSTGPMRIDVLDGRYRLRSRNRSMRWTNQAEPIARRIEVDTSAWPDEVEVAGKTILLPQAEIRLLEAIELRQPINGSVVDLNEVELQWQPVPGASWYQLQLSYTMLNTAVAVAGGPRSPVSTTEYFFTVRSDSHRLRVADLSGAERKAVLQNWIKGRTAGWQVDAYDTADQRLGTAIGESHFLVGSPLDNPTK
jgi:hypothetical protein